MLEAPTPLEIAGRVGLAIGMAVFMGLAFEGIYKREERSSPGGIRTFPMLALLGALLYLIDPKTLLPALVGLAGLVLWLYAYVRAAARSLGAQPGLMVPAANLLAYAFGPAAFLLPAWLVVAAAIVAVMLLESRQALHRLVSNLDPEEVFTLGKFLILVGIVLPLVPNHPVVPWTPITPFKVWLALVAVSTLSYISYLLQRYLPARPGTPLLPALLGGLYSSTATTVVLARRQHEAAEPRAELTAGIVLATAVMYVRIDVVIAIFNLRLAALLFPPLAGLCALTAGIALWQWRRRPEAGRAAAPRGAPPAASAGSAGGAAAPAVAKLPSINPLQLTTAVVFAALFVIVSIASTWSRSRFGSTGVYALGAISGVTDIDPYVLSLAQGSVAGMSLSALAAAILIAASSNNVLKAAYALLFGRARACLRAALVLTALGLAGAGVALLYAL